MNLWVGIFGRGVNLKVWQWWRFRVNLENSNCWILEEGRDLDKTVADAHLEQSLLFVVNLINLFIGNCSMEAVSIWSMGVIVLDQFFLRKSSLTSTYCKMSRYRRVLKRWNRDPDVITVLKLIRLKRLLME